MIEPHLLAVARNIWKAPFVPKLRIAPASAAAVYDGYSGSADSLARESWFISFKTASGACYPSAAMKR